MQWADGADDISELNHDISNDDMCKSLRATLREEFAGIRLDIRTILHNELANAQRSPGHQELHPIYASHGPVSKGSAHRDACIPTQRVSLTPSSAEVINTPKTLVAVSADGARRPESAKQEQPEPNAVVGDRWPQSSLVQTDGWVQDRLSASTEPPSPKQEQPWQPAVRISPGKRPPIRLSLNSTDTRDSDGEPQFHMRVARAPRAPRWTVGRRSLRATSHAQQMSLSASLKHTTLAALKEARQVRMLEIAERRRRDNETHNLAARLRQFVKKSVYFDGICGTLVVINAGILGLQVDWAARSDHGDQDYAFKMLDIFFCLAFLLEWCLRLFAHGRHFFAKTLWFWHLFDTVLVGSQVFEEAAQIAAGAVNGPKESKVGHFSALRVLRFLRLLKILRTVRVLRLVGELRTLVLSIGGSLKALFWAVVLLFLLMYVMGIFVTQIVSESLQDVEQSEAMDPDMRLKLKYYYGSLGDTVLSVYKAITSGIDWGDLLDPLKAVSVYFVPFMMSYIAFATMCMLNVITGVFVESALAATKRDNKLFMVQRLKALLILMDLDGDQRINSMEFFLASDTPEIQSVFHDLELPLNEQERIFEALGTSNEQDSLSIEEFVRGCQLMGSPAKTYDVKFMQLEHAKTIKTVQEWQYGVDAILSRLSTTLDDVASHFQSPAAAVPKKSITNTPPADQPQWQVLRGRPLAVSKPPLLPNWIDGSDGGDGL